MTTPISPYSPIKTLFDTAPGYFFVTDTTSQVLYTNRAIEERTGFSPDEIIGKKPGQLWGGRMPRSFYQKLWHTIQVKQQVFIERVTNQRKNNEVYQEDIYIFPLQKEETVKYFISFNPDIQNASEKKQCRKILQGLLGSQERHKTILIHKILSFIKGDTLHEKIISERLSPLSIIENNLIEPTKIQYQNRILDHTLIHSAQRNKKEFEILYNKYHKVILFYFLKHLFDHSVAEDLSQETFLRAFSHLSGFVPSNATYQTYLLRIAHNMLVNYYRRKIPLSLEEKEVTQLSSSSKIDTFCTKETIDHALSYIPRIQQDILTLFYTEGYSVREIAHTLGKSENAIKLQLSRVRKALKMLLEA